MDIFAIDSEIINCIPPKSGERNSRYKYCGGWTDYKNMGLACLCAYRSSDQAKFYFADRSCSFDIPIKFLDSSESPIDLNFAASNHMIWGFNSCGFDDKLFVANDIAFRSDWDLLYEVRYAAYGTINYYDQPRGYSYKLDDIARFNLGRGKIGHGEIAPEQWQRGEYKAVLDYCVDDCFLLSQLVSLFLKEKLKDPNTGHIVSPRSTIFQSTTYEFFHLVDPRHKSDLNPSLN